MALRDANRKLKAKGRLIDLVHVSGGRGIFFCSLIKSKRVCALGNDGWRGTGTDYLIKR